MKGFQLEYLAKVPEVKDTVHKHSLLHHLCHMVMEKFPDSTDLYSEVSGSNDKTRKTRVANTMDKIYRSKYIREYIQIFRQKVVKIMITGFNVENISVCILKYLIIHWENFMAIFTTLSVVIWFSTGTLGIFATLFYVFTMRVVIYDIVSMAIITTLSTFILFCNFYYILLWISPRSVVIISREMG